jgi:transitional endoplasmic reticulum ATPase
MDGMNDLGRVCVIASTIRPSARTPRSGVGQVRPQIEVGLPDAEARLHILSIHAQDMPTAPDLDLKQIATVTRDYSGADLEALCREAAMVCMRRSINLRDFEKRITTHKLGSLSITTYDFRTAMKRVRPSVKR